MGPWSQRTAGKYRMLLKRATVDSRAGRSNTSQVGGRGIGRIVPRTAAVVDSDVRPAKRGLMGIQYLMLGIWKWPTGCPAIRKWRNGPN